MGCTKAILESHLYNKILKFENFRCLDDLSSYTEKVKKEEERKETEFKKKKT